MIRRKHLSYSTERSYVSWLRRYCVWIAEHPEGNSTEKVTAYLTHLARNGASAVNQNQALNALVMFYRDVRQTEIGRIDALRAKRSHHERYCPSVEECRAILSSVKDVAGYPTRLVMHMLYGCGLRLREPLNIRLMDIDLDNSRIVIRRAKGQKDRVVGIPCNLIEPIRKQHAVASALWAQDAAIALPVKLPTAVARKYGSYATTQGWAWLFPSRTPCQDSRTGTTCRWHMHETNVQRACRQAAKAIGLFGVVTPHCLRHGYATHAMRQGANVRDVQQVMGHKSLETTMGYLHPECGSVKSPIESIACSL